MVRSNPADATYASNVSATAAPSENPVVDMMIEMGHDTTHGSDVNTTPGFNAPSQDTDTSIVESDALRPAGVVPNYFLQRGKTLPPTAHYNTKREWKPSIR